MRRDKYLRRAALMVGMALACGVAGGQEKSVTVRVDASATLGPIGAIWAYFGYDEPNYTTAAPGRELIGELTALSSVPIHLRTHNLLTTGDGVAALKWGSTNA